MTDQELIKILEEMEQMFSQPLPNPDKEPRRFEYYVRLYKYYKQRGF